MVSVTLAMNFTEVSDVACKSIEDKSINRSSKAIKMPVDKRITPATASTAAPGRPISAAVNCVVVVVDDDDDDDDGDGDDIDTKSKSFRNAKSIRKFVNEIAD
jgi:hypothetical protein